MKLLKSSIYKEALPEWILEKNEPLLYLLPEYVMAASVTEGKNLVLM